VITQHAAAGEGQLQMQLVDSVRANLRRRGEIEDRLA
jgi:hypothetical protein